MSDSDSWSDSENYKEILKGKKSYIYKCTKKELCWILTKHKIQFQDYSSIDELRKLLSIYYCGKQSETIKQKMSTFGELKQFEGDRWEAFQQQLECFIHLNDVEDDKKVSLLITKLTSKVYETLCHLCAPEKPTKLPYKDLCEKLSQNYVRTRSTALERATFRKRNQKPGESIEDYVLELRKLGGKCMYKDLDDQIKEKFIEGVSAKIIKFELLKDTTKTNTLDIK